MSKTVKAVLLVTLFLCLVLVSAVGPVSAVQMKRQVLDGGGAVWLETASYKLSSSLGQSIIGV
jgi:hypothetical protein